jgi:type VI secretion system secreted protein Hcp
MAMDQAFKIGDIKGESANKAFKDQIDVLAWSWGMSNSGSTHAGSGGGSGKVNVQDLSFTKYVDKATPALMKACCTGVHEKDAVLTVRKGGGTKALEYIKITLTEVIVTSISTGGSGGEDRLTENISLNFAKVKFEYTEQTGTGTSGTTIPFAYDIASVSEE